jgi:hypothetical protein
MGKGFVLWILETLDHFPVGSNHDHTITAAWFETRGVAALFTMRVSDLIPRSPP